jgi:hypothetical protein
MIHPQGKEAFMRTVFSLFLLASPVFAQDFLSFQSPSGNISCMLMTGEYVGARCDMRQLSPSYRKRPVDCDLEWGDSFEVGARGQGGLTCHGDTVISPDAFVLDYGKSVSLGGVTCESAESGMTCRNDRGHGFSISKARQKVF